MPIVISLASLAAFGRASPWFRFLPPHSVWPPLVGGMGSGASVAIVQTFAGFPKLEWSLNLWLVSSAIGDAIITIALVWYLVSAFPASGTDVLIGDSSPRGAQDSKPLTMSSIKSYEVGSLSCASP